MIKPFFGGSMNLLLFFLLITSFSYADNAEKLSQIKEVKRFIFGSCNDQNSPQILWKEIVKQKPDLFIWAGDNVYADKEHPTNLALAYEKQNKIPGYIRMKKEVPIIGTWDDHDYAYNNADGTYKDKAESQRLLMDFLEEPKDSERRHQEGVYTSYEYGPPSKRVKFILLDDRYFLNLDKEAPFLGEDQWQWLENELQTTKAKLVFIMSGLSILSPKIPLSDGSWANYPGERQRLLDLVDSAKEERGIIFLTGDMHFSSIFRRMGHLEFLSSSLTEIVPRILWWYLGRMYETSFFGIGYGQVDIAWEDSMPVVTLSIRNRKSEAAHKRTFRLVDNVWIEDFSLILF